MSTLVLTSLNPHGNIGHQLRCLEEWAKIGYEARSYNFDLESEVLREGGLQTEHLVRISIEDTAEGLFGKPIPRILPLLKKALQTEHDFFILTNSDIFPAHRKVISASLAQSYEFAAFTRTECLDIALSEFHLQSYYRGGLDLFWFTRNGLINLVDKLSRSSVAERMTFGVPGWDYYLGHVLCNEFQAPIIDGSIFIHQSHKTSYSRIDEFEHFATELTNSGKYAAQDPTALAHEFAMFIQKKCSESRNTSNLFKLAYYKQPSTPPTSNEDLLTKNQRILKRFAEHLDSAQIRCTFSGTELGVFANKQFEGSGWPAAISLANRHSRQHPVMFHKLQLLLFAILCIYQNKNRLLTLKYPQGNLHTVALKQIVRNESGTKRDRYIFDLFASELVDHGIVNLNLVKYLFTATRTSDERTLFLHIISVCKLGLRHA